MLQTQSNAFKKLIISSIAQYRAICRLNKTARPPPLSKVLYKLSILATNGTEFI